MANRAAGQGVEAVAMSVKHFPSEAERSIHMSQMRVTFSNRYLRTHMLRRSDRDMGGVMGYFPRDQGGCLHHLLLPIAISW